MNLEAGTSTGPVLDECWSKIGVQGDMSCPELKVHVHCRNCPVFSRAAASFFDRPPPLDYRSEWSNFLALPISEEESRATSALIFRLGVEWLALETRFVAEVTLPRPVHTIPHRSNDVLVGLVNLRGQIRICISLHGLIEVVTAGDPPESGSKRRLVVIGGQGARWVFAADEVNGIERIAHSDLRGIPATLANPASSFSEATFAYAGSTVGLLDGERLFQAIPERIR